MTPFKIIYHHIHSNMCCIRYLVSMTRTYCDKLSTFEGNGCCVANLGDADSIRVLTPISIVHVLLTLSDFQVSLQGNEICSVFDSKVTCDGKSHMMRASSSSNDLSTLKVKVVEALLADWLRNQQGRYDMELLNCMSRYCLNIGRERDLVIVGGLIRGLMVEVGRRYGNQ